MSYTGEKTSGHGREKTLEETTSMARFSSFEFRYFDDAEDGGIRMYVNSHSVAWLLCVPRQEYERWGNPDMITGQQILDYNARL